MDSSNEWETLKNRSHKEEALMANFKSAMSMLQNSVAEREPFNEDTIFFRENENIEEIITNVLKGLEIINGVEFISCKVENFKHIYEDKKPEGEIIDQEREDLDKLTSWNKGSNKSSKTSYPLVSITQSRLMSIKIKMRFTDSKSSEENEYELYYPELIDGMYYQLSGSKFSPVLQLVDAEYYRSSGVSIVLKTAFMPITLKGVKKPEFIDFDEKLNEGKPYNARLLELVLFKSNINVFIYYFAKFGIDETLRLFKIDQHYNFIFEPVEGIERKEDKLYFKLTTKMTLEVSQSWVEENMIVHSNILNTFVAAFKKKHIDESSMYDTDYWRRQLGKFFSTNTSKTLEKSESIILSLERLLDNTTRNNMRNDASEKENVYQIIETMCYQFENIIRIDNYDLANKRIRVAEYILYPFIEKLSRSVYRLIGVRQPTISKMKQIFSSIDPGFIVKKANSMPLVRYSNSVNTLDLFTKLLKGSKTGPQSQNTDSNSPNIGMRGIDNSYIGRLSIVSTSTGDPGLSFTVTPFCERRDPNENNNFYFTDKPRVDNFNASVAENASNIIEVEEELEIEDIE